MKEKIPITFRPSGETFEKIKELSDRQERSMAYLINLMVVEQLKRIEAEGFDAIYYEAGTD